MAGHAKAKRPLKKASADSITVCRRYFSGMELLGHNVLTHRQIMATTDDGPCSTIEVPAPPEYAMGMLDSFRCDLHGHILLMIYEATHTAPLEQQSKGNSR